jgi:hypothetical protein
MTFGTGYGSGYSVTTTVSIKGRKKLFFKQKPQFFMPLTKAVTVKFRIPIFWVNKFDIELDLPVYYDVIYEKILTVSYSSNTMVILKTSKIREFGVKIDTFLEKTLNISLKPDFRLEKVKNLSKLRKLLNNMENVD